MLPKKKEKEKKQGHCAQDQCRVGKVDTSIGVHGSNQTPLWLDEHFYYTALKSCIFLLSQWQSADAKTRMRKKRV